MADLIISVPDGDYCEGQSRNCPALEKCDDDRDFCNNFWVRLKENEPEGYPFKCPACLKAIKNAKERLHGR